MAINAILSILSSPETQDGRMPFLSDQIIFIRIGEKIKECLASDKGKVFRPAREARDLMKALDSENYLQGVF